LDAGVTPVNVCRVEAEAKHFRRAHGHAPLRKYAVFAVIEIFRLNNTEP